MNLLKKFRATQRTEAVPEFRHYNQIVVSKKELLHQLAKAEQSNNLLSCLAYGPEHPNYPYWLLMASMRFWFIGGLCYSDNDSHTIHKPQRKVYERMVFENFLENEKEAQECLEWLVKQNGGERAKITGPELLAKYVAARIACIRMLASTREYYFAEEYGHIIDYIASHEDFDARFKAGSDIPSLPPNLQSRVYGENFGDILN